jgi:hypothetical protein
MDHSAGHGGRIVGLLTMENIGELIMVNAALAGKATKMSHAG